MHLIEILLPLFDNEGRPFEGGLHARVREELVEQYGGLTAFTRNPAEGLWDDEGQRRRDEIVIFEVMADSFDRNWWRSYREGLERRFRQEDIVVRSHEIERL